MSDAHSLYEQHDDFEDRVSTLRTHFNADVEEFGSWDAEENRSTGDSLELRKISSGCITASTTLGR